MIYLLDTNVLIDAKRDYYPIKRIPEFWDWLVFLGNSGVVKIPLEIYEEIEEGNEDDPLAIWSKQSETKTALLLNENVDPTLVAEVISRGYANDLFDHEVEKLGRDPFLIAYTLKDLANRVLVTTEVSRPSRTRGSRHIPDVCNDLSIQWCNTFKFIEILDFSTNWKNQII